MKKSLDAFGVTGAILNIITCVFEIIGSIGLIVLVILDIGIDFEGIIYLSFSIIALTLSIITIVLNARVLAGETKYKNVASVMGFVCFSILGSIFLTISKESEISVENYNNLNYLIKLKELLDAKVINEDEYMELKKKLF